MSSATHSQASSLTRIKLLDNRLANQIAAGEVVERPASVVKELLENSIDSGATKIELDIERGGARLIRVTDNGKGIIKDDLGLALTRHATSKISSEEDLAAIRSLGFRGEALASISSVSKLTLTSRPHDEELAWQAIAHGRDMAVEILPAASAAGTRIEVAELFYNTPARQKFLRTEKTEFSHIEEVFKQHALANPKIAFVLKHNHKVVKRIPAAHKSEALKRIAAICGSPFSQNCIPFDCQHELMHINGWLGKPEFHRSESDIQYVFINGRPIKDKVLSHAIRQAYQQYLPPGRMATFVIFIQMDPHQVDVNVHPTKHEVRFGQQRLVHDLIAKSINDALSDSFSNQSLFDSDEKEQKVGSVESLPEEQFWRQREATPGTKIQSQQAERVTHESLKLTTRPSPHIHKVSQETLKAVAVQKGLATDSKHIAETNGYPEPTSYSEPTSHSEATSHGTDSVNESSPPTKRQQSQQDKSSLTEAAFYVGEGYWVVPKQEGGLLAINQQKLVSLHLQELLDKNQRCENKSLLFPIEVSVCEEVIEDFQNHELLKLLGFAFEPLESQCLKIAAVPDWSFNLTTDSLKAVLEDCFASSLETAELIEKLSKAVELNASQLASVFQKCESNLTEDIAKPITSELLQSLF